MMTKRLAGLLALAESAGLENPLGRAVYALNRSYNAGSGSLGRGVDLQRVDLQRMERAKPETADRWLAHWEGGGHPKSLGHRRTRRYDDPHHSVTSRVLPGRRAISFEKDLR